MEGRSQRLTKANQNSQIDKELNVRHRKSFQASKNRIKMLDRTPSSIPALSEAKKTCREKSLYFGQLRSTVPGFFEPKRRISETSSQCLGIDESLSLIFAEEDLGLKAVTSILSLLARSMQCHLLGSFGQSRSKLTEVGHTERIAKIEV